MSAIVEILCRMLFTIVFCLVLLPLIMILATPMILLGAAFVRQGYFEAVKSGYRNAFEFWKSVSEVMPSL